MKSQKLITRGVYGVVATLSLWVGAVHAGGMDGTGGTPSADLYLSPKPSSSFGVAPSGAINLTPSLDPETSLVKPVITNTAAPVGEISNTLGCAGIGQGEFTSGLYNMPEVFSKFQSDVNSVLSKNLLSLNFVMPQTSALFDQLNTMGNQRYDQFQRGCSVSALQQDARTQAIHACVEKLTPERKTKIEEINATLAANAKIPPAQIGPMAYAQAWEVCSNQYVSDTTALQVRNDTLKSFYEDTRKLERVNDAIVPLLCPDTDDTNGCWQQFLLPQVRICLADNLQGGCSAEGYGMKEPVISMQRLFDAMRFVIEDEVIARRVVSATTQIRAANVDPETLELAANDAVLKMSTAALFRNNSSGTFTGSDVSLQPLKPVADFQLGYLSCKEADALLPWKQYQNSLKDRLGSERAAKIKDVPNMYEPELAAVVKKMKIPSMDDAGATVNKEADVTAIAALLKTAIGCTVNQSIPMFDPNIMYSLQATCTPEDVASFYMIAGYDVSLTATRDVYRYLNVKLKQTYARLLTESLVKVSKTDSTSTSPTLSPELNNRFATVVKEVMIPYVESQIERLDELNKTRGVFGTRVREIYGSKGGCISQPAGFVLPNGETATFRP